MKSWDVTFLHGVNVTEEDVAPFRGEGVSEEDAIKEAAVELFNNLDMDDLYMSEEDVYSIDESDDDEDED